MKKLKVYLDTSVVSFVYADDAPEKQSITVEFFEKYLSAYDVYISEVVLAEIQNTSNLKLRQKLKGIISDYHLKILDIDPESRKNIFTLARSYLKARVIPEKKFDDAVHVALCTHYEFDILLSWNFRHLANIDKQIKINNLNKKYGYPKSLLLLNPMEVIYDKN